jgi:hypothetical protein
MSEPLSLSLRPIIDKMGSLISEGKVTKTAFAGGWRYSGESFLEQIAKLKKAMTDGGNEVSDDVLSSIFPSNEATLGC